MNSLRRVEVWRALAAGMVLAAIAVAVGYNLWREWGRLAEWPAEFHWQWLLAAALPYTAGLALIIAAWHLTLVWLGASTTYRRDFKLYCYSNLVRNLPGQIWHGVGRVYLYRREGTPAAVTTTAFLLERLWSAAASALVTVAALPLLPLDMPEVLRWVIPAVAVVGFLAMPWLLRAAFGWLARRSSVQVTVSLTAPQSLLRLAMTCAVLAFGGAAQYCILNSVAAVELAHLPVLIGGWGASLLAANLIFWLPSGLGVRDGITALVMGTLVPMPVAVTAAILWRLWGIAAEAVSAVIASRL